MSVVEYLDVVYESVSSGNKINGITFVHLCHAHIMKNMTNDISSAYEHIYKKQGAKQYEKVHIELKKMFKTISQIRQYDKKYWSILKYWSYWVVIMKTQGVFVGVIQAKN
jgi:hypothetical protein